jgi:hypothetical protein
VTSLVFSSGPTWSTPQTVTVTGVNDTVPIADGLHPYTIVFTQTTSPGDTAYAAITPGNVSVSNIDNDTAGITVSDISAHTTEGGGTAYFTIVLNSLPFADVTVNFASDTLTEGTLDKTSVLFVPGVWNVPQTVTATGVNDSVPVADGNQPYAVTFSATASTDLAYAVLVPGDVAITNDDNDSANIVVSAISGPTTEAGGTATFTVVLNSQPFGMVTVNFDSNDMTEGTVGVTSLTFDAGTWDTPQTVTVTGVDDLVIDCAVSYAIVFTATTGGDAAYNAITPSSVSVLNQDDDAGGASTAYCLNWTGGSGQTGNAATCAPWLTFSSNLTGSFSSITMSGSNNPTGKTCADVGNATTICNALRTKTPINVTCDGNVWRTGGCGTDINGQPAYELSINGGICSCPTDPNVFIMRPCLLNRNIGGIGTATCNSPTQTFQVVCTP